MTISNEKNSRIAAAIAAAEKRTSAEIVVAVLDRSAAYRSEAMLLGILGMLLPYALISVFLPTLEWYYGIAIVAVIGLLTLWGAGRSALAVRLAPPAYRDRHARQVARALFLDRGLDTTPQRNAILLFVSLAEHYVEILPDRGWSQWTQDKAWLDMVQAFKAKARRDVDDAIVATIEALTVLAEKHHPAGGENPDLLSNAPIGSLEMTEQA